MINKKTFLLIAATIFTGLLIFVSCSSISVNQDYNTEFDFSKWKTFGFIPIPESAGIDQINASRLGDAAKKQLEAKGYKLAEPADFGVAFQFGKQQVTDVQSYGYGWGWGGYGYGPGGGVDVTQYEQGTLIIDFVDMKGNKLEWRGTGQGALDDNPSVEDRIANIDTAVAQILAQFPPNGMSK
jgi:hypothetical protein